MDVAAKRDALRLRLLAMGRTLVAYSGGVDSAFLAYEASRALGNNMLALIANSPSLAARQLQDALAFAGEQRIPCEVIATEELANPAYAKNDGLRCFHCKDELFSVMEQVRSARGFDAIAYGVNVDDQRDFRPGQAAARERQIAAPLLDAGLTKSEIRDLAQQAGLRVWNKPASACLASRIEYGRPVTQAALAAIEQGEDALAALGFREFRVRHHGATVRLEIALGEMSRALDANMAARFTAIFKELGFTYVTLDLEGFRSGSMNAVLPVDTLTRPRS